jgi:hypothetical protein
MVKGWVIKKEGKGGGIIKTIIIATIMVIIIMIS